MQKQAWHASTALWLDQDSPESGSSITFKGGLREQDAFIGNDSHCLAANGAKARDERTAVQLLKLITARAVQNPR